MVEGLVRYTPLIQQALDLFVPMDAKPGGVREVEQNLMTSGPKSSS